MKASEKKIRSLAFVIESSGHAPEGLPAELRGPTPDELYEWREFDLELEEKIRKGEFYVDPETREVRRR